MTKVALVIGVARYGNFNNLEKTVKDAGAIAQILEQEGNYVIEPLPRKLDATNESRYEFEADPKKEVKYKDLLAKIKYFLGEQAKGKDALIYFAGHGFIAKNDADDDIGFFAATDSSKDGQNSLSFDIFTKLVAKSELKSLVVLLDCCHAGNLLERSQYQGMQKVFNDKNYYLMAACGGSERAREGKEHGIFTAGILNVLEAKIKEGERIDLDLLFSAVSAKLEQSGQEVIRTAGGGAITLIEKTRGNVSTVVDENCPYVGLNAFDESTAQWFFGRETAFKRLMSKIEQSPFVFVVGVSGSGKSSLVKAKLIPEMKQRGHRILLMKPWSNPIQKLKDVFAEILEETGTDVSEFERRIDTDGLLGAIADLPKPILLVIDQFEEVFTVCSQVADRRKFIQMLVDVAQTQTADFVVVATMRIDFLADCTYANLDAIVNEQMVVISGMSEDELRDAIAKPAETQGYQLSDGLLDAILQDIEAEPNCLPLLEFALQELWGNRNRQQRRLNLEGYRLMERLKGALNRHADRLYGQLSASGKEWMRRIFLTLVRTGKDAKDTRQRERRQVILDLAGNDGNARKEIERILKSLEGKSGRLLVASEENGVAIMDLAHEALMDGWQRFAEWRLEDRDLRRLGDRVKDGIEEFNTAKVENKNKFLLPEGLVAQIEEAEVAINDYLTPEQQEFVQRSRCKYKPWLDRPNLPELVDIPSGTFWMGSPEGKGREDEKPYHQVTVKAFQMGKYPVTQAQWRTVAMSPKVEIDLSLNPSQFRGEDCPVEKVDWYEAQEFCARLSQLTGETYRLPSEAEWEYACRAGAHTEYCFGDYEGQLWEYAWYKENSDSKTGLVGQKRPNAWGLYDLHGNVWEWCADDCHDSYEGAPTDSQIWAENVANYEEDGKTRKMLRGGSWIDDAQHCRSAFRNDGRNARNQSFIVGFRVVCVLR